MNTLNNAQLAKGTRVFVRCDLDVQVSEGRIVETYRLDHLIPTLRYIVSKGAFPVIAGHIGRPGGVATPSLSTKQLKTYFDSALGVRNYELLENLRFDPREEEPSEEFAKELAHKAEVYVNECFPTSHRNHTSISLLPRLLPSYAGFRLEEEVKTLGAVLASPQRPFVSVIGGAKVESKGPVIENLLEICDTVLVGGVISQKYRLQSTWLQAKYKPAQDYQNNGLDIGPETIQGFVQIISSAKSIIWAGPMGLYEKGFMEGTKQVAKAIIDSGAFSVVGGGETIAAINKLGVLQKFSFVSTGGGAMLDFITNPNLSGLTVLGFKK